MVLRQRLFGFLKEFIEFSEGKNTRHHLVNDHTKGINIAPFIVPKQTIKDYKRKMDNAEGWSDRELGSVTSGASHCHVASISEREMGTAVERPKSPTLAVTTSSGLYELI